MNILAGFLGGFAWETLRIWVAAQTSEVAGEAGEMTPGSTPTACRHVFHPD